MTKLIGLGGLFVAGVFLLTVKRVKKYSPAVSSPLEYFDPFASQDVEDI